jgi:hypothetical protein
MNTLNANNLALKVDAIFVHFSIQKTRMLCNCAQHACCAGCLTPTNHIKFVYFSVSLFTRLVIIINNIVSAPFEYGVMDNAKRHVTITLKYLWVILFG